MKMVIPNVSVIELLGEGKNEMLGQKKTLPNSGVLHRSSHRLGSILYMRFKLQKRGLSFVLLDCTISNDLN